MNGLTVARSIEEDRNSPWFFRAFAVLVVAAGLLWLFAPLSFWQRYGWTAPLATSVAAGMATITLWQWFRMKRDRKSPPRRSAFAVYGCHCIIAAYTLLLGERMARGLKGEALWLAVLCELAFYAAIALCVGTIQQRHFDPPLQADELINDDPPQEYNILLIVLGFGAILLYFAFVQPLLRHLPVSAQRAIGFLVFVAAFLSAQWYGYRHLRSNRLRPPATG